MWFLPALAKKAIDKVRNAIVKKGTQNTPVGGTGGQTPPKPQQPKPS